MQKTEIKKEDISEKTVMLEKHAYEQLAAAIIEQALRDYCNAINALEKNSNDHVAKASKKEIEQFFDSEYFGILSDANPEYLMREVKRGCGLLQLKGA